MSKLTVITERALGVPWNWLAMLATTCVTPHPMLVIRPVMQAAACVISARAPANG